MRQAKGFSVQNELTVKLLLLLAVRKCWRWCKSASIEISVNHDNR